MQTLESLAITEQLLHIQIKTSAMLFGKRSPVCSKLAVVHIIHDSVPCTIHSSAHIECKLEILKKAQLREGRTRKGIAIGYIPIQRHQPKRIGIRSLRTHHSGIPTVSKIVNLHSTFVQQDLSGTVSNIDRINRGHRSRKTEYIAHRSGTSLITITVVVIIVGICHISSDFQPFLSLKISLKTSCIAIHISTVYYTLIIEITEGSQKRSLFHATGDADIVFLTQRLSICLLHPIIRRQKILCAIVIHHISESRSRIDHSISSNEFLTIWNGKHLITQATIPHRPRNPLRSQRMGILNA